MSPRVRFTLYLAAVHLLLAALAVALFQTSPWLLLPLEAAFIASLAAGIGLSRSLLRHLEFVGSGAQMLADGEFTSRLREVGQPDVDRLIGLYNRMVDSLRDERVRLQEQHHFLTQIVRVSPSGIVILDFDRRVMTMNPAAERLLEQPSTEAIGQPLEALSSPLGRALGALPPHRSEVVTVGGARRVRCHHGTFIDRGFPRSFVLVEELTEELRQAERGAYEKLIRVMAHEVNNSVAASNSLLHSSLTYGRELSAASRPDFERAIGIVIGRTEQLSTFMRRFADVFKLPPPVKAPTRVMDVLENNVRLLQARPDASGMSWQWDVDDRDAEVTMDRGQIEQAIINILKNAVEAAGPSGTITIRLHARNDKPALIVEDSGPEMSPEASANLFTPFFSTKPHGQGIGLTVVQEILTAHGFDYALERVSGEPTRFTIRFA